NADAYTCLGVVYDRRKEPQKALEQINKALELEPESFLNWKNRAAFKSQLGDIDGAISDMDRAIEIDSTQASAYAERSRWLLTKGQLDASLIDIGRSVELTPDNPGYRRDYYAALLRAKQPREILRVSEKHNDVSMDAYEFKVRAKFLLGDLAGGVADARTAKEMGSTHANIDNVLSFIEKYPKPYAEIVRLDKIIAENSGNPQAWIDRGSFKLKKLDMPIGAIEDFDEAIALDPKNENAHKSRAEAKFKAKDYRGTVDDLSRVLEISPDNPDVLLNRGFAQMELGKFAEAEADFNRSLEMRPDSAEVLNARGVLRMRQQRWPVALADFSRAVEISPEYFEARKNRITVKMHTRNFVGLHPDLDKALELKPDDVALIQSKSAILYAEDKFAEMVEFLNAAIARNPTNADALFFRAVAKLRLSPADISGAKADLEQALKLSPQHKQAQELLQQIRQSKL
ncbi:MAG: tetratricopeptide repeat protein, partial [Puniceicoccales bacterium]|nr:tetratricopeptide repeat protein [Puniceicoccales bacterium]